MKIYGDTFGCEKPQSFHLVPLAHQLLIYLDHTTHPPWPQQQEASLSSITCEQNEPAKYQLDLWGCRRVSRESSCLVRVITPGLTEQAWWDWWREGCSLNIRLTCESPARHTSCPQTHEDPVNLIGTLNPSNAEATFVQNTRMQRFVKTIWILSCWCLLDSSHWVLSDEYQYAMVSVIFTFVASFCNGKISHHQHKG